MAVSTNHNKYVSIPDWFSNSSSAATTVTQPSTSTPTQTIIVGGSSAPSSNDYTNIPIDGQTIVWNNNLLQVPIDNDTLILENGLLAVSNNASGLWELRQSTDGTNYIYTTYPVVTQLGITMYAGTDGLNLGNIYDGLPIDGVTLYWSYDSEGNKILKSAGSVDGEGGVSDFWALHNIPSWITVSKPYYTTSEISEGNNLYFTNARAVSALAETLKYYVTLGDTQTITGEKNFTGGLKVNGSPIYYDTDKKYWKLEGDLLVTGGVTMYGSDSSFTPSTIMDAIAVDGVTISKSGGVLKVIGGTGGGVADSVAWSNITGKPNFASVATSGKYDDLIGKPTLLSSFTDDVVSGKYLPLSGGTLTGNILLGGTTTNKIGTNIVNTTSWQEFTHQNSHGYIAIGPFNDSVAHIYTDRPSFYFNKDLYVNDAKVWHAGNDGGGSGLDADLLDGKHNGELTASILHSGGGFVIDTNTIQFSDFSLRFYSGIPNTSTNLPTSSGYQNGLLVLPLHTNGSTAQIYLSVGKNPYFRSHHTYEWNELAYKTDNVASATKLQTARTIWGHNFDGTENVFGQLYLNASKIVWHDDANNYYIGCPTVTGGAMLEYKAYSGHAFLGGNVGIGTASPKQKLHVEGHIWANGDIAAKTKIQSFGNLIVNGNVGIGTENPTGKLSVNGTVYLTEGTVDNYSYIRSSNYTNNTARLIIGTCYGYKTEVNALSIYNGQVGIGTTTPTTKFDINGKSMEIGTSIYGSGGVGSEIYMSTHREGSTLCARGMRMYVSGSETGVFQSFSIDAKNYSTLSNIMSINSSGNLLVTGGVTMYSDQRKKTILNHVELSLKQIADAPLIEHYYNSDDKKTTHVGSIAQYWASMNDWFCKLDSEGFYIMEIQNAALASAISIARELDRYENKTDKDIKKLKKRICELEEEIERLKAS